MSSSLLEQIPAPFREGAQRMAAALKEADRVLISGHTNPDGDAVGALAAAALILKALGKEFCLYSHTGIPQYLHFLPLPACVHTSLERLPFKPQYALLLDCGEPHRLGEALAEALPAIPHRLNIDHHLGSAGMGNRANWVEPRAAATAQLVAYTALAADLPLQGPLADALALGLITDTGGFSHGNSTAEVFALAALLAGGGCNLAALREKLDSNWSLARMRLWGRLMQKAQLLFDGRLAFCAVALEDLRQCAALKEDLEGFVEQLRRLAGVHMACLLREDSPQVCKFSLRSYGNVDVRTVAAGLGGGGHFNAAGGTIQTPLETAQNHLLTAIKAQLDSPS